MLDQDKVVVYFDGHCGLCNKFVDFLIDKDQKDIFRFSTLQSERARQRLSPQYTEADDLQTVVVEFRGKYYFKSKAALVALSQLGGLHRAFQLALIIPQFISDLVYDFVARHRYAWFGREETCRLPSASEKAKFLD